MPTTLKEFLKTVKCPKCENSKYDKFELYFVLIEKQLSLVVHCFECDSDFEIPEVVKLIPLEKYMLKLKRGTGDKMINIKEDIPIITDEDWQKSCQPHTWRRAIWNDGRKVAYFFDTKGHGLSLEEHKIANDGTVTPSVVCPIQGCGFHDFIKLEGWVS